MHSHCRKGCRFPLIQDLNFLMKGDKAEKITIDKLSDETLDIISEMLNIICSRTGMDPNERGIHRMTLLTIRFYAYRMRS